MSYLKVLMLVLSLSLIACSNKKKQQNLEDDLSESVVMSDDVDDELDELEDISVANDTPEEVMVEEVAMESEPKADAEMEEIAVSGGVREYVVQKNDTLMWIAFKIYGDYSHWRKVAKYNGVKGNSLKEGMTLKYEAPTEEFNWNPEGNPYLVMNGDTLGKVSNKVYGKSQWWKSIYENNKPMIKNPNLIFAGFTIYYLPASEVALK